MTDHSGAHLVFCILDSLCQLKNRVTKKDVLAAFLQGVDVGNCDFSSYDMLEGDTNVERTLLHLGLAKRTKEGDVEVQYLDYKPEIPKKKPPKVTRKKDKPEVEGKPVDKPGDESGYSMLCDYIITGVYNKSSKHED